MNGQPTRFKPVALRLNVHAELAKIAERKSKELGTTISVPKVVEMFISKYGDKV